MLRGSDQALSAVYDIAVLDLDGVVYVGEAAVDGAAHHLWSASDAGMQVAYVTNNASRTPHAVVRKLDGLGMPVADGDVVTSAQAAARVLADQLAPGARVFLIGGDGLETALVDAGLTPVREAAEDPEAVVQGFGPDLPWSRVVAGATLVRQGLPWVTSNTDLTFPTALGIGPGNGTLVRLIADFAGRDPVVAGKPSPPLLQETQRRVGGQRPLMVGDRLDTDIAGADAVGWPSLLVLTGVTGLPELVAAPAGQRPTYLCEDLGGLLVAHPEPSRTDEWWTVGGWAARVSDGALEVDGDGVPDDWWRAVASAAWSALDQGAPPPDCSRVRPPRDDDR
ncbi:haloacid dehalogenase [Marmoricola endophyticus]|uniref:Haloacid dehalogenase n=1 Tax=Marmoricola endophyticus TaxID=2040280 RepID=A0A917BB37_9ACTN|nr:HAD-IIA family hydrolase [Marmoricola endophyticus]GGF35387.1 haloacid dehalogenase [Marmoricola endophyticus]